MYAGYLLKAGTSLRKLAQLEQSISYFFYLPAPAFTLVTDAPQMVQSRSIRPDGSVLVGLAVDSP
jgi:hypothetical protein